VATRVFLFTDIEGSTKLWSDYPTQMPEALAEHDDLINTAVLAAGGHVFKHTGDGVCAVFSSAADAVTAAAWAQRSLTAAEWGDIGPLRVRMAVHAGDAEPRGDDWSGPALNRTARIMGLGYGGQVLLSSSAYELASDALDADLAVIDLGTHLLRGLARPEHIWQLTADGLDRDFPPLRSIDGARGWLPHDLTSFVGRATECEQVADRLRQARLVTLVGPGGVGKSRLATEVGATLLDKFPDGVWMFELAGLAGADGLEPLLTATIGLSGGTGAAPREALLNVVRTWRALFIVDNCEHLLRDAAELVDCLLVAAPDLVVLTTSRERLHLPGEQVLVLNPLPVDVGGAATELFTDRAGALRDPSGRDFDSKIVARLCQRLDGMPLAIELAAARTVAMTPAEIERRLDQRFRLLTQTGATDQRHGSLRGVLDWSYDLLTIECQTFFVRLSVFAGSFDAAAAYAVAWPEDEFAALDMLEDLVAKSLLGATSQWDRTSYRMLETMRQYGAPRLADVEAAGLRRRHAEYFASLAAASWDGCRGRDSRWWLEVLDDELDDVRAAFEWSVGCENTDTAIRIAAGLFMYNQTRRLQEIYRWVDDALALPGASQRHLSHAAFLHRAYGNYMRGELGPAEDEIRAVLNVLDPDDPLRPTALTWLAGAVGNAGRILECRDHAEALLAETERLGPAFDYDRAEALWSLCTVALVTGAPDHTLALRLLTHARGLGNVRAIAGGLIQVGVAEPDPVRGMASLVEALELTAQTRDSYRHGLARMWLGALQSELDPPTGLAAIREVVDHARRTGQGLLVRQMPRSYFGGLSAMGRHQAIAALDGAALIIAIRPNITAAAIARARAILGDDHYDELKGTGATMTTDDVAAFLLAAVDDL
jgi:predicted ATPase/class 3 adenylate cyclase